MCNACIILSVCVCVCSHLLHRISSRSNTFLCKFSLKLFSFVAHNMYAFRRQSNIMHIMYKHNIFGWWEFQCELIFFSTQKLVAIPLSSLGCVNWCCFANISINFTLNILYLIIITEQARHNSSNICMPYINHSWEQDGNSKIQSIFILCNTLSEATFGNVCLFVCIIQKIFNSHNDRKNASNSIKINFGEYFCFNETISLA